MMHIAKAVRDQRGRIGDVEVGIVVACNSDDVVLDRPGKAWIEALDQHLSQEEIYEPDRSKVTILLSSHTHCGPLDEARQNYNGCEITLLPGDCLSNGSRNADPNLALEHAQDLAHELSALRVSIRVDHLEYIIEACQELLKHAKKGGMHEDRG